MNPFASLEGEDNISSVFFYICNNLKVRSKTDSGSPYSDRRKKLLATHVTKSRP
ncbi:AEL_collapsed_G0000890.mRNA.1.CDS.1 [Saccharomyces cerevisiae]|nr:BFP_1a_G0000820.mRNA.1.CDS.1 [Saccharomyces cerevisiae]CAI4937997.1 BBT_HP_G0036660.mRNA.1.CDS.1 [Saccharomyces cerevisiae]CAI4996315.1 BBT_HP_G0076750.mRNA.1.CDS.1 [Saccharomyces cerevisiae]CAI5228185.1 ASB_HP2_G0000120.mRNA.1.CDS.1 [Saccharomyces cerevisiae]CAI5258654.1 ADM_HP2_G0000850.mRNA.1.CDS.1 [Saccharomyces cerevisiae]